MHIVFAHNIKRLTQRASVNFTGINITRLKRKQRRPNGSQEGTQLHKRRR